MVDLLERLTNVTPSGDGWEASCPAHEDRDPSLTVSRGDDGRWLVRCHRGCTFTEIVAALGLQARDLFPHETETSTRSTIVATYDYRDADGTLQFQVARFAPKDFRQRRPDGAGGWIWNLRGVERLVYRLDALQTATWCLIVEGEKDADALAALGFPATTCPGGAGKWTDAYTHQLLEAGVQRVAILPDHDLPGAKHADAVAVSLQAAGVEVRIVDLGLDAKGADVSDYLDAGHTVDELKVQIKAAATYQPPADEGLTFITLGELFDEPDEAVDYVVEDRIAVGSVNLIAGSPKDGKSTTVRCLAWEVARGGRFLGRPCTAGLVWYLALEDKKSEVKRHFRRLGASRTDKLEFLFPRDHPDLLDGLDRRARRERPALIIVDTVQRLIRATDLNDYAEVTTKLTPILTLARETAAAVLLVHHTGKGVRQGVDAVLGSTALAGSVDNVFLLGRSERFRVLSSHQRIGPDLEGVTLKLDPETGAVTAGPSKWDAEVDAVADELLATLRKSSSSPTKDEWIAEVSARRQVAFAAVKRLLERGAVTQTGSGKRGNPFLYSVAETVSRSAGSPKRGEPPSSSLSSSHVPPGSDDSGNPPQDHDHERF